MAASRGTARPGGCVAFLLLAALAGACAQLTNRGAQINKECPAVCSGCLPDGSCEYCAPGAMQVGEPAPNGAVTCVKCQDPLCSECGPTPATCRECYTWWSEAQPDYDPDAPDWPVYQSPDGRCNKCVNHPLSSNCEECGPYGGCRRCKMGYALTPNGCKKCQGGDECAACDPRTLQCTECSSGSGLDDQKQCRQCSTGTDEDGDPLCQECQEDYQVCTVCNEGYYVDTRNQCSKLPDGCAEATPNGVCTKCSPGKFLTAAKTCVPCGKGCATCASATTCAECDLSYVLTPAKTCLACGPDCEQCVLIAPGRTRCTSCESLTLINGACWRCDDPRCADCSGNVSVCKACKNEGYIVNKATGRCQNPAWPGPRQRPSEGPGHRNGNAGQPASGGAGRRLLASGNPAAPAIVNGKNATRGRYPYMTSLRVMAKSGESHNCGGALVHERVVLTAAHCILRGLAWANENTVFPEIRIGGYEIDGGQYEVRHGKWAVVPPGVAESGNHLVDDFALLLLDRPSLMRPVLRLPGAVPRPAAAPGTPLTIIGWGDTGFDENGDRTNPTVLQEAVIEMLPLKECASYFPQEQWANQFCAGRVEKKIDTCQGDSGGPVVWRSPAGPAGDLSVGVVSWGYGCAENTPGVYADVAAEVQWIRSTIQWLLREDNAGRIPGPAPR